MYHRTTSNPTIISIYPSISNSPRKSQPGQILGDTGCSAVTESLIMPTLAQSWKIQGLRGQNYVTINYITFNSTRFAFKRKINDFY